MERLRRLRTRLRDLADLDVVHHATQVAMVDHELEAVRAAEDAARTSAPGAGVAGAALVLAWAHADALARRAMGLLDDRVRAVTAAEGSCEVQRERRREEEQLARLAARAETQADERAARARQRALDDLALWLHGRMR